jgi:GH15 family glucan-1,4-alpha-glucosidase
VPSAIEDYALIGDCETAALVARDGSIDWLCLPRFDSAACFAALLGTPDNGRWQIAPVAEYRVTRRYREKTLILETQFDTEGGTVTLIDFMPIRTKAPEIIRLVRGDRGKVQMRMDFVVRFDYGQAVPWVTRQPDGALFAIAGPNLLALRTPVELRGEGLRTIGDFTVTAGTTTGFGLTYGSSFGRAPRPTDLESALGKTAKWWRKWVARCTYHGPEADAVEGSLITLKALTYAPTGGLLAAATTSLPEQFGGQRNWDYRYCWLRDATFSLLALLHAGYREEARRWRDWLLRAAAGSAEQLQIMYAVAAERRMPEWEVPWLPGYMGASPVRIGNAAAEQIQLDVYGEVADALHQARTRTKSKTDAAMDLLRELLENLEKIWRQPDHGIWEFRGPGRQFTHSKVMAWLAFDRAIKTCERFGLDGHLDSWREIRQEIHDDVCHSGFDAELGTFVQSYGSKEVDASLLLIPLVGFLPPGDPRILGTVQQIEKCLIRDGLVIRYDTEKAEDGLPAGEGVFLACSFWLADAYHLLGQNEKAQELLERMLRLRNDVGLLAEEYDPKRKSLAGNFPQAFSHVGLVNTVINLNMPSGPARQRSGSRGHNPKPPL